ncbi:MAG: amidohydrolase family protein [Candidatus Marinimicrobia bacterium]|nr:amidohydrolase family protein [Candidatus Neomarinimicrobiota bacterium]
MKDFTYKFSLLIFVVLSFVNSQTIAIKAAKIYTAEKGRVYNNGILLIKNGKIVSVGKNIRIPNKAKILDYSNYEIVPGFIDNHSHIGTPPENLNEFPVVFGPQHKIVDILSPDKTFWEKAYKGGVTTVVTGPGSGEVSSGQAVVIKTWGGSIEERILLEKGGIKIAMGGKRSSPKTSMAVTSFLREKFIKAKEYQKKKDTWLEGKKDSSSPEKDLSLEAFSDVLSGKDRIRAHVHSAHDILSILRLKDEFNFDLTLHHSTEAYKVPEEIAKRNVKVVGMPLFARIGISDSVMYTGKIMNDHGILFAFHTDDPVVSSKWQRGNAGMGIRYGMTEQAALEAITINPALIANVSERVGSLKKGKDADFVIIDGRWYEPKSRIVKVYINGMEVFDRSTIEK